MRSSFSRGMQKTERRMDTRVRKLAPGEGANLL